MTDDGRAFTEAQEAAAATWLARQDRGLSGSEQDVYLEWLAEDPAHAQAIQQLEQVWKLCDRLVECHPTYRGQQSSKSLAPRSRKPRWLLIAGTLTAMAAALALLLLLPSGGPNAEAERIAKGPSTAVSSWVLTGMNGDQRLADGSLIEMQRDTIIAVNFTAAERRVQLVRGEAFFTVAHDATKPFVVEVAGVTVQALGTVFSVGLDQFDVSVEVTEGSVEVREPEAEGLEASHGFVLAAGEKRVLQYRRLIPFDEIPGGRDGTAPQD